MNEENLLPFQRVDAYKVAKELARRVHLAKIRDAELRDQATRASKSAFLGLCEGLRGFVGLHTPTWFRGGRAARDRGRRPESLKRPHCVAS